MVRTLRAASDDLHLSSGIGVVPRVRDSTAMAVRKDCRHYSTRTTASGDRIQRCRVDANEKAPFACPEHCLFFEPRSITDAGWRRFEEG